MPHAALWVVQLVGGMMSSAVSSSFNAARGFVGGAASMSTSASTTLTVSMPHAALWVVQLRLAENVKDVGEMFQCRTRLCGWCSHNEKEVDGIVSGFQCRTRLCGWCSGKFPHDSSVWRVVSMPHAALWVVQLISRTTITSRIAVSMPHAALWVVQPM